MDYKDLYEKWQNDKYFVIDSDRLKSRCYVFSSFPNSNMYGFQTGKIRSLIMGDIIARYNRLKNRNVLFPIGFNTLSQSSFIESRKSSNSLNDDIAMIFYNQMIRCGISINNMKLIDLRKDSYISNIQLNFIDLYEKGYIKYHNTLVAYDSKTNKIYDAKINSEMPKKSMKAFELDIKPILDSVINDIKELDINIDIKDELIDYFKPIDVLQFELSCSNDNILNVEMENPEYLGGVAYIFLNPEYIDISNYVSYDEYDDNYLKDPKNLFAYSGVSAVNPLTGENIPIFISYLYGTGVYLGIPGINDEDLTLAVTEGFEYKEILENNILKNSDFLDGKDPKSAHDLIFDTFTNAEIAISKNGYMHTSILIHQLDKFGALFPFLEYKNNIESLKDYLPFNFSSQFRPILSPDVNIPGTPIDGTMASNISSGMASLISIGYDEIGFMDSLFSQYAYNDMCDYLPIDTMFIEKDNIINELLMPIIFYNIIKREHPNMPLFVKKVVVLNKAIDVKLNDIKRSNNNLIDFDKILDNHNPDSIRAFAIMSEANEELVFNEYLIEDYDTYLKKIKNRIIKEDYSIDYDIKFNVFAENMDILLARGDLVNYLKEVIKFTNENVLENTFSKRDLLVYLRVIHPIFPFLSESLYEELFNGRFSIVNEGYPF